MINERGEIANPAWYEQQAQKVCEAEGLAIQVVNQAELQRLGLNLLNAVGQGAQVPPRLVLMQYNGNPSAPEQKVALVGKGITFDTGGINMKPTGFIEDMYMDNSGAATVLATLQAISSTPLTPLLGECS